MHDQPSVQAQWAADGWSPRGAFIWVRLGFDTDEASQWADAVSTTSFDLQPFEFSDPEDWYSSTAARADMACEFREHGFRPEDAEDVRCISDDPGEASAWLAAGFSLDQSCEWVRYASVRDPEEASVW